MSHRPGDATYELLKPEQLLDMPAPESLIEGIVPEGGLSTLFAPGSTGKSFLALDWACSVGAGVPWLGRTVGTGVVVYFAAEGVFGFGARYRAWLSAHPGTTPTLLRILPRPVNLLQAEALDTARRTLALLHPVRLIIIDTAARSMVGGDENDAKDMAQFVAAVDELRAGAGAAAALVLHHSRRSDGAIRGSSVLHDSSDVVLKLERQLGRQIVLSCEKPPRDAPPFDDVVLRLDDAADSCVLSEVLSDTQSRLASQLLQLVREADGAVSTKALRQIVKVRMEATVRALESLERDGSIARESAGWIVLPATGKGPERRPPSGLPAPDVPPLPMRPEGAGSTVPGASRAAIPDGGVPVGHPLGNASSSAEEAHR